MTRQCNVTIGFYPGDYIEPYFLTSYNKHLIFHPLTQIQNQTLNNGNVNFHCQVFHSITSIPSLSSVLHRLHHRAVVFVDGLSLAVVGPIAVTLSRSVNHHCSALHRCVPPPTDKSAAQQALVASPRCSPTKNEMFAYPKGHEGQGR